MTRIGRPPKGTGLVEKLEGSDPAKERLRAILGTITGETSPHVAAKDLDVDVSRVDQLRTRMLQEALAGMEPRKPGRRPKVQDPRDEEIMRLRRELDRFHGIVKTLEVQTELALAGIEPRAGRSKKSARARSK